MQERVKLTDAQINRDLLRSTTENPLWYWLLVGFLATAVLVAFAAVAYMFNRGLGVTGLNRPVMWGFFHHQLRILDWNQPRGGHAFGNSPAGTGGCGAVPPLGPPRS